MRKRLSVCAVAAVTMFLSVLSPGHALAFGAEQLGCRVAPASIYQPISTPTCGDTMAPNPHYNVSFAVLSQTGSYTYACSVPYPYSGSIINGCGSSDDWCQVSANNTEQTITMSVTITQSGQSRTLSATAETERWCGNYRC